MGQLSFYLPFSLTRRSARFFATLAAGLLFLSSINVALAQMTHYTDVPEGAYYEEAASVLLEIGALDTGETRLRPGDLATRAEMIKLLVQVHGEDLIHPSTSSFNDVPRSAWYFPYFETAASVGWVKGDSDCYQRTRPCTARPSANLNRAEAAALLNRAFALERTGAAPQFPDVPQDQWYYIHMQTAADHCIIQGDMGTGRARPASFMNRAEMVVMFHRAYMNMQYGEDCGEPMTSPRIESIDAETSSRITVTFSQDLNRTRAEDEGRYSIRRVGGSLSETIGVETATFVNSRTVQLELEEDIDVDTNYTFMASNLLTTGGATFSQSGRFTFEGEEGEISGATATADNRIRITFNTDIERARAEEEFRYAVSLVGGTETLSVQNATWIDDRTIELQVSGTLRQDSTYRVTLQNLRTDTGVTFSDTTTFSGPAGVTGNITSITTPSSTRLVLNFNTDIDAARAEQSNRYRVSDGSRNLQVRTANLVGSRTVELSLTESMLAQRQYTVSALDMSTTQGVAFSDTETVVFNAGGNVNFRTTLTGGQEVPPVVTTAGGSGTFVLTSTGLQYDITLRGLSGSTITAAHFHIGNPGIAGPPVQDITFTGNRATGTWTDLTMEERNAIISGGMYVNVHTAARPDGEIRGQILAQ